MDRDLSKDDCSLQLLNTDELKLPSLPSSLENSLLRGNTLSVDGTNVVRVPFGVRQARRKRPERPERIATLILPFQPHGNNPPPPQAA